MRAPPDETGNHDIEPLLTTTLPALDENRDHAKDIRRRTPT